MKNIKCSYRALIALLLAAMVSTLAACGAISPVATTEAATEAETTAETTAEKEEETEAETEAATEEVTETEAEVEESSEEDAVLVEMGEGSTVFDFIVVDNTGASTNFKISTDETTVGAALQALEIIDGEVSTYGLYVTEVMGVTADWDKDQAYWAFYINDEYAMTGVDSTDITEGDVYSLVYTGPETETEAAGAEEVIIELGEGSRTIGFTVVDAEGVETSYLIHTDETTVGAALLKEELIEGTESEYGLYVTVVNGITADWDADKAYWAFYINDEYAMTGVDATDIEDGASYSFVYTAE